MIRFQYIRRNTEVNMTKKYIKMIDYPERTKEKIEANLVRMITFRLLASYLLSGNEKMIKNKQIEERLFVLVGDIFSTFIKFLSFFFWKSNIFIVIPL